VASEYAVKWDLLRDAALKGHTEEALVRIIIPVDATDSVQVRADQLWREIAPRLMNEVERVLPSSKAIPAPTSTAMALDARG
jgi:hypothetical protein